MKVAGVDQCYFELLFISFRNIFQSRTSTGFRDEHIWVSIVDPPSRSPFTRAQRVSCCMSLLLCTMAINIAFWNIPINEDSPVMLSLGQSLKHTFHPRGKTSPYVNFIRLCFRHLIITSHLHNKPTLMRKFL